MKSRLDGPHIAGDAGVDGRRYKGVAVGHLLAHQDIVPGLYKRRQLRPEMLLHREDDLFWGPRLRMGEALVCSFSKPDAPALRCVP